MKQSRLLAACVGCALTLVAQAVIAQSQGGVVRGNTQINAVVGQQTAVAAGAGNLAQGNVGVVRGNVSGNTGVNAVVGNMTTVATGVGNTAKTNVGVVKDRSNAKLTVGVASVTNVVGGTGQKGCVNIGTKGIEACD